MHAVNADTYINIMNEDQKVFMIPVKKRKSEKMKRKKVDFSWLMWNGFSSE
jgi:hypothetical protein